MPEKQDTRWRKLIFKSSEIAYRIDREARVVYVVRVWHAARNEIDIQQLELQNFKKIVGFSGLLDIIW